MAFGPHSSFKVAVAKKNVIVVSHKWKLMLLLLYYFLGKTFQIVIFPRKTFTRKEWKKPQTRVYCLRGIPLHSAIVGFPLLIHEKEGSFLVLCFPFLMSIYD